MPSLHELQRAFCAAMLAEKEGDVYGVILADGFGAAERLRIYRNTFRSTLTATLRMTYPADHIADAVLAGDDAAIAQVNLASGPVHLVVHRGMHGVEAQRLAPESYRFVARLCSGEALGRLLDDAPENAPALLAEQLTN